MTMSDTESAMPANGIKETELLYECYYWRNHSYQSMYFHCMLKLECLVKTFFRHCFFILFFVFHNRFWCLQLLNIFLPKYNRLLSQLGLHGVLFEQYSSWFLQFVSHFDIKWHSQYLAFLSRFLFVQHGMSALPNPCQPKQRNRPIIQFSNVTDFIQSECEARLYPACLQHATLLVKYSCFA